MESKARRAFCNYELANWERRHLGGETVGADHRAARSPFPTGNTGIGNISTLATFLSGRGDCPRWDDCSQMANVHKCHHCHQYKYEGRRGDCPHGVAGVCPHGAAARGLSPWGGDGGLSPGGAIPIGTGNTGIGNISTLATFLRGRMGTVPSEARRKIFKKICQRGCAEKKNVLQFTTSAEEPGLERARRRLLPIKTERKN